LDGVNFKPNTTEAVAGAVGEPSPTSGPGPSAGAAISASDLVLQGDDLEALGTDPALLKEALDKQNVLQNELNAKYTTAQLQQSDVEAAVAKATAADGPQAGILVREQYARDGYRSPDQYGAQLQAVADNKYAIQNVVDTVARQDAATLDADRKQDIADMKEAAAREAQPPTFFERTRQEALKKYNEYKEVFTRTPVDLTQGLSQEEKEEYEKRAAAIPFYQKFPFSILTGGVPLNNPSEAELAAEAAKEALRKKQVNN
jgi:hypothetical protein